MEAKAIVMAMIGFLLLYGGLAACIGIAWYHSKQQASREDNNCFPAETQRR